MRDATILKFGQVALRHDSVNNLINLVQITKVSDAMTIGALSGLVHNGRQRMKTGLSRALQHHLGSWVEFFRYLSIRMVNNLAYR